MCNLFLFFFLFVADELPRPTVAHDWVHNFVDTHNSNVKALNDFLRKACNAGKIFAENSLAQLRTLEDHAASTCYERFLYHAGQVNDNCLNKFIYISHRIKCFERKWVVYRKMKSFQEGMFCCRVCMCHFESAKVIDEHIMRHVEISEGLHLFYCAFCIYFSSARNDIIYHLVQEHKTLLHL